MTVEEEGKKSIIRNEVSQFNVAPFDAEVVDYCIGALRSHGCVIAISSDRYTVFFPQGTIQEEILPRTLDMRYKLLFPDGFEIESIVRRGSDLHTLRMPKSVLPEHLRGNYSRH